LKGCKYVIIKTHVQNSIEYKAILFDEWYWHGNFIKDNRKVHSCGFFSIVMDPYDDYGFKVVCGGEATDFKPGASPGDAKIIKELLGYEIMYYK
jgi:hypothetical protein